MYYIEISFKIKKNESFQDLQNNVKELSELSNCSSFCNLSEVEGENNKIKINNLISLISFQEETNLFYFIKEINKNKKYYIDCIFNEYKSELLYASSYYLKHKINKQNKNKFKNFKNKLNINNLQSIIN